jgi:hypothetical protein
MGSDRVPGVVTARSAWRACRTECTACVRGPRVDSSSGSMSRPVLCDLPSSCGGSVNPLTRWLTTLKCEEPHCLADLNGWVAIAWQAAETSPGGGRAAGCDACR